MEALFQTWRLALGTSRERCRSRILVALLAASGLVACGGGEPTSAVSDAVSASPNPPAAAPIDSLAPTISVTGPSTGASYSTSAASIAVAGVATDNVGVQSVVWSNDRGGAGTATGQASWSVASIGLQPGANLLSFTVRDAAGNTASATLTVSYSSPVGVSPDTQGPALVVVSPSTTGTYATTSSAVNVSGTASDNVAVSQVAWSNDRGGAGVANTVSPWSIVVPLQLGVNVLTITARDAIGNARSVTLRVTNSAPDATAPAIAITAPTSSSTYVSTAATISVGGTATDNVAVTQVTWTNDRGGSGTASGQSSWSVPSIILQVGSNLLTFVARDAAGNVASKILTVSYASSAAQTFYLSPSGSDANDGATASSPLKTFARAFASMRAGDELVLLNGVYSAAASTGTIHWDNGSASAQIPSGTSTRATKVRALNPGAVTIQGPLFIGRSTRKDSHIQVQGITFEGGAALYNTSFVTIKDSGFHGSFDIGTNDHDQGNTDNLIEDVWVWSSGVRIIAINYRAHRNVWRRVVVRGDGCGTAACAGSGNPNVGFTVYDSMDVSIQNMLVVDRILLGGDSPYADFACAQHTPEARYYFGRNEWLGVMSLNSPDTGFYCEPDSGGTLDPSIKVSNAVFWNSAGGAINLARSGTNNRVENLLAHGVSSDAVRVAPELGNLGGALRSAIVMGSGRYGLNSAYAASHVNVTGTWATATYNQTTPSNIVSGDPRANGSLKYLPRIESGSPLKGQGFGGSDLGATILYRYGADGSRHGDTGFNALSGTSLWPWPNEARIRAEMCASTARGFCSTGKRLDNVNPVSFTSYVWEMLGTPMPATLGP
jgi:hypothetical protein